MDMLGYSLGAMRERKLRAILTIAMVMMGAGMIVGLNGLTTGANLYISGQFKTLGANVIIVWGNARPPTDKTAIDIGKIADVKATAPFLMQPATILSGNANNSILVMGENQEYLTQVYPSLRLAEGNFVAPNDSLGIVLGHSLAYPSNSSIPVTHVGSFVNISYIISEEQTVSRRFLVRGILAEMGAVVAYSGAYSVDRMAFISLPAAISFFEGPAGAYTGLNVIATGPQQAEPIAAAIRQTYGSSFEVDTLQSIIRVVQNITSAFSALTAAIASVSLIVASVGIFTGLYTSVTERTKEIGLLKAIGFKKRGILGVFFGEAALVGIIGGALGDALGVGLGYAMAYSAGTVATDIYMAAGETVSYIPPSFTPENFVFVLAFSTLVSILAGAYPAWKASRLDPVVALRKE
jgi:putative ABC transport system permease protein